MGPDVKLRWAKSGLVCKNNPRSQVSDFSPNECCLLLCTSHWVCLQVGDSFFETFLCFLSKNTSFSSTQPRMWQQNWSHRDIARLIHRLRSRSFDCCTERFRWLIGSVLQTLHLPASRRIRVGVPERGESRGAVGTHGGVRGRRACGPSNLSAN